MKRFIKFPYIVLSKKLVEYFTKYPPGVGPRRIVTERTLKEFMEAAIAKKKQQNLSVKSDK